MNSKTIATPSRNHVKRATASRAAASPSTRRSNANKSIATPARKNGVKQLAKAAVVVPLATRALKKVKTKAGIAVLAGVALAVAGGLVHKYRKTG
jgi:hypothetical protein